MGREGTRNKAQTTLGTCFFINISFFSTDVLFLVYKIPPTQSRAVTTPSLAENTSRRGVTSSQLVPPSLEMRVGGVPTPPFWLPRHKQGPNDETWFHHLCPRLKTRLQCVSSLRYIPFYYTNKNFIPSPSLAQNASWRGLFFIFISLRTPEMCLLLGFLLLIEVHSIK